MRLDDLAVGRLARELADVPHFWAHRVHVCPQPRLCVGGLARTQTRSLAKWLPRAGSTSRPPCWSRALALDKSLRRRASKGIRRHDGAGLGSPRFDPRASKPPVPLGAFAGLSLAQACGLRVTPRVACAGSVNQPQSGPPTATRAHRDVRLAPGAFGWHRNGLCRRRRTVRSRSHSGLRTVHHRIVFQLAPSGHTRRGGFWASLFRPTRARHDRVLMAHVTGTPKSLAVAFVK
jgi:hypothetical protein